MNQSVKKWLCIGAGFGAGTVLMAALLIGGIAWYTSRPKPWDEKAIQASFATDLYKVTDDFDITGATIEYVLENKTAHDYTLLPDQTFMILGQGSMRPSVTGKYKIAESCFVPAGNKVKCEIEVPVDYDTSLSVDGFAVFDLATRYKLMFPKPQHPTPQERENTIEHFKQMKATRGRTVR